MRRRTLIAGIVGAAVWPLGARAQQKAMSVVGFLSGRSLADSALQVGAFRQGLAEAGFIEGRNLSIEYGWAERDYDRLSNLAADLVARKVDVIVGNSNVAARAAKGASQTIPIISAFGGDPVADGLLASLARPGGNLKAAKALGLTIPSSLLARANEVIE